MASFLHFWWLFICILCNWSVCYAFCYLSLVWETSSWLFCSFGLYVCRALIDYSRYSDLNFSGMMRKSANYQTLFVLILFAGWLSFLSLYLLFGETVTVQSFAWILYKMSFRFLWISKTGIFSSEKRRHGSCFKKNSKENEKISNVGKRRKKKEVQE